MCVREEWMGYTWNGWTRGCRDAKFCVSTVGVRVYKLICGIRGETEEKKCPPWFSDRLQSFDFLDCESGDLGYCFDWNAGSFHGSSVF